MWDSDSLIVWEPPDPAADRLPPGQQAACGLTWAALGRAQRVLESVLARHLQAHGAPAASAPAQAVLVARLGAARAAAAEPAPLFVAAAVDVATGRLSPAQALAALRQALAADHGEEG